MVNATLIRSGYYVREKMDQDSVHQKKKIVQLQQMEYYYPHPTKTVDLVTGNKVSRGKI